MIWHYFPIGMRFPVTDFSEQTRRACWEIALSAAFASDARETGLYEACETYDPGTLGPVYTCIICYPDVRQSRAAGKTMQALDRLMTRLCLHDPLVQANYLESFGPYPVLAEIDAEGVVRPNENGEAFLPTGPIEPMQPSKGRTLLLAPDSMKNVCDAEKLTRIVGTAAADHGLRVRRMPIADGGEGTVRALVDGTNGRYESAACEDLNGERVRMTIGVIPGPVAVIEAADAVGFLRKNENTPPIGRRSSRGVGLLIRKALDLGYRELWIGLGGSLTVDLGLGALDALGVRFLDAEGAAVDPCPDTFSGIEQIDRTDADPRLAKCRIVLLSDVTAPLLGPEGALRVFGPQKGATDEQIEQWETQFKRLSALLGGDPEAPGSGAAGGLGFALASIGGTSVCGADRILDQIGISFALREADFVITGEGSFDMQSVRFRKAPVALLERLSESGRPGCLLIGKCGVAEEEILKEYPNLKRIVACPAGETPYADALTGAFEGTVLPLIGKDIANVRQK